MFQEWMNEYQKIINNEEGNMDKNVLKYELGVETEEEARTACLEVIDNIKKVMDIKGLRYVETFLRLLDFKK